MACQHIEIPPIQDTPCPERVVFSPWGFYGLAKSVRNTSNRFEIEVVRGKFTRTFSGRGSLPIEIIGKHVEIKCDEPGKAVIKIEEWQS